MKKGIFFGFATTQKIPLALYVVQITLQMNVCFPLGLFATTKQKHSTLLKQYKINMAILGTIKENLFICSWGSVICKSFSANYPLAG